MQLGFVDATQGPFWSDSDFNARNREVRFTPRSSESSAEGYMHSAVRLMEIAPMPWIITP